MIKFEDVCYDIVVNHSDKLLNKYTKQCEDAELIDEVLYEMYDVLIELG